MNATSDTARTAHAVDLDRRTVLHLGSGQRYRNDAVNVDIVADVSPDVVCNLNVRPWPFPADRFTEVVLTDVLEHLDDTIAAMEEIHRVSKNGAKVQIVVPHFSCANAYIDPTHKRFFSASTFHYLTGENNFGFYSKARFRRVRSEIVFKLSPLNKIVRRVANRFPDEYEQRWAWMFPAWFLNFELEVVKHG